MSSESLPAPFLYRVASKIAKVAPIKNGNVCPNTGAVQLIIGYAAVNLIPINNGEQYIAVDGGTDKKGRNISRYLDTQGKRLEDINAAYYTHGHYDHLGLAAVLMSTDARQYVSEEDSHVLTGAKRSEGQIPGLFHRILRADIPGLKPEIIKAGECHEYGPTTLEAISTYGHTSGSMSFGVTTPGGSALFTGDAVDIGIDNSIKLPPKKTSHDMQQSRQGLMVIAEYADTYPDSMIYPSHSAGISGKQFLQSLASSNY